MMELYEKNPDFKCYVDKYCKTYRIPVEEALEHELVKETGRMYKEKEDETYHGR